MNEDTGDAVDKWADTAFKVGDLPAAIIRRQVRARNFGDSGTRSDHVKRLGDAEVSLMLCGKRKRAELKEGTETRKTIADMLECRMLLLGNRGEEQCAGIHLGMRIGPVVRPCLPGTVNSVHGVWK